MQQSKPRFLSFVQVTRYLPFRIIVGSLELHPLQRTCCLAHTVIIRGRLKHGFGIPLPLESRGHPDSKRTSKGAFAGIASFSGSTFHRRPFIWPYFSHHFPVPPAGIQTLAFHRAASGSASLTDRRLLRLEAYITGTGFPGEGPSIRFRLSA